MAAIMLSSAPTRSIACTVTRTSVRPVAAPVASRRSIVQKRQVLVMAENPIKKAAEDVQEKAKDFGDAISKNAEDTAEKTEQGYKEIKPDNKNPTDKYRSTDILKSDEKYTPKSDPKK